MRIDFLQRTVQRALEHPTRPLLRGQEELAKVITLNIDSFSWANLLSGTKLDFGLKTGRDCEAYLVTAGWNPTTVQGYESSRGSDWPVWSWGRRSEEGVVVRSVGRGAKYRQLLAKDLGRRADQAPWLAEVYRRLEEAWKARPSPSKSRAKKYLPSAGREVSGTEVHQQHTLIARDAQDWPVALWTLDVSMFFANAVPPAIEDYVPTLHLEVVSAWSAGDGCAGACAEAFKAAVAKLAVEALEGVAFALTNVIDDGRGFESRDLPFAVKVVLPPAMRDLESEVGALLGQILDPEAFVYGTMDSHAKVCRVDVEVGQPQTATRRAETKGAREQAKEAGANQKASLAPGDLYTLVALEPKEFCGGADGKLYPAWLAELEASWQEYSSESPQELLQDHEIDVEDVRSLLRQGAWDQVQSLCKQAAAQSFHGDDPEDLDVLLMEAVQLCVMGPSTIAPKSVLFVLKDEATGAQVASLGPVEADVISFLRQATAEPSVDAGQATLGALPRQLKVAASLVKQYPQIQAWCDSNQVERIFPKGGFDAIAVIAREWHDRLRFFDRWPAWYHGAGQTFDELIRWVQQLCLETHPNHPKP